MDFGVGYFPTHDGMTPGAVARFVEERGQSALFFAEHSHIPANRESPWSGGAQLPQKYWHTLDLFVALTAAAEATSRLRVGSDDQGENNGAEQTGSPVHASNLMRRLASALLPLSSVSDNPASWAGGPAAPT